MIASLGDDRDRYRTTEDFQAAAGIAPLTEQSGGSLQISAHCSLAATKYIKQTFHEYAGLRSLRASGQKRLLRPATVQRKTQTDGQACLAYKWIRIIYRSWQNGQPYNESHYLNRLLQTTLARGSTAS